MANPINDHLLVTCSACGGLYEADSCCICQRDTIQEELRVLEENLTEEAVEVARAYLDGTSEDCPF